MRKLEGGGGNSEWGMRKWEGGVRKAEFRSKIGIVEKESDESLFWLEVLKESGIAKEELHVETDELVAIFINR